MSHIGHHNPLPPGTATEDSQTPGDSSRDQPGSSLLEPTAHQAPGSASGSVQIPPYTYSLTLGIIGTIAGVFILLTFILLATVVHLVRKQRTTLVDPNIGSETMSMRPSEYRFPAGDAEDDDFLYESSCDMNLLSPNGYGKFPSSHLSNSRAATPLNVSQCSFCKKFTVPIAVGKPAAADATEVFRASTGKISMRRLNKVTSLRPMGKSNTFNCLKGGGGGGSEREKGSETKLIQSSSSRQSYATLNDIVGSETKL